MTAAAAAEKVLMEATGELGWREVAGEVEVGVVPGSVVEVEEEGGTAKVGEEARGASLPSTSTTLDPRLNGAALELGGDGRSGGVPEELDLLFQMDLDRLETDPGGESVGAAKEEEAAGGGFVGVPPEGSEVLEDEEEFLEEKPRVLRILEDFRLRRVEGRGKTDGQIRRVEIAS